MGVVTQYTISNPLLGLKHDSRQRALSFLEVSDEADRILFLRRARRGRASELIVHCRAEVHV